MKPVESHRWPRQCVPVLVPQPEPLEIREKEHMDVRKNLHNLWIVRNFLNDHLFLLNRDFPNVLSRLTCSYLLLMDFYYTQAQKTLRKEEVKQRPEVQISTAVLENCVFTKSVMSKLSSKMSVVKQKSLQVLAQCVQSQVRKTRTRSPELVQH